MTIKRFLPWDILLGQLLTRWIECLIPTFVSIFDSTTFHVWPYLRESSSTFGVMEGCVVRLKKPLSLLSNVTRDSARGTYKGGGAEQESCWEERISQKQRPWEILARKVFQTVFWLMILKVFLMTTCFRMDSLRPHYNDDFMHFYWWMNFLSWNESNIYLSINHQSRLYNRFTFGNHKYEDRGVQCIWFQSFNIMYIITGWRERNSQKWCIFQVIM